MEYQPRYRFLIKPVFFIFSLLSAGFIVLKLEQLTPGDVGMEMPSYRTVEATNAPLEKPDTLDAKQKELFEKAH